MQRPVFRLRTRISNWRASRRYQRRTRLRLTNLPAAVRPRFAGTRTGDGHAPDPECAVAGRSDPSPDSSDTTTRDQTGPSDRPAHNSPRNWLETTEPVLDIPGGPQTFFRKASDSMCLSRERSATSRFNRLFSSSSWHSRRSSLTPRWAYFFFQAQKFAQRCRVAGRNHRWGYPIRLAGGRR